MPDDNEQQTSADPTTVDDAAARTGEDTDAGTQPAEDSQVGDDTPPEGAETDEEPFDAARAQAKIRKANQEAASLRKRLKAIEPLAAKAKEIEDAQKTEVQRLQDRLDAAERRSAEFRGRAVTSEVRAMAADLFADKTDPEAHLDLDTYIGDGGEIDTDQIKADLAELLERKPHLGKPKPKDTEEPERRRRPAPDRTQASGANQTRPKNHADEFAGFVNSQLLKGRR